jgi:predicted ABC-type ATPase
LSLLFDFLDKRPLIIALAGSNGAGKSTLYDSFLADGGLRFVNADKLSASLGLLP